MSYILLHCSNFAVIVFVR